MLFLKVIIKVATKLDYKAALSISVTWIANQSLFLLTRSRGYRGHLAFPDGVLYDTSLYTRSYKFTPAQWAQEGAINFIRYSSSEGGDYP
ncbi:hypothetical protein EHD93_22340 [Escherichia coli]|uniref:Uncharacterized protein n=1 Tax=Escherichia coli TaxID=562 RepID=A0A826J960_ECOLX|nr:hypothetical protein RG34_23960 [Escherichia coli]EFZ71995.1 hypothetical protein ECRN5871_5088 [Escherichia coli RN587/1]EII88761.1 hypothetical protein EC3003_2182 [Escherichia coli 3003]HEB1577521.1 hypothetical protein [Escherichia albertii]EEV9325088.1 hypothetical protein [Escherichia coli]